MTKTTGAFEIRITIMVKQTIWIRVYSIMYIERDIEIKVQGYLKHNTNGLFRYFSGQTYKIWSNFKKLPLIEQVFIIPRSFQKKNVAWYALHQTLGVDYHDRYWGTTENVHVYNSRNYSAISSHIRLISHSLCLTVA